MAMIVYAILIQQLYVEQYYLAHTVLLTFRSTNSIQCYYHGYSEEQREHRKRNKSCDNSCNVMQNGLGVDEEE